MFSSKNAPECPGLKSVFNSIDCFVNDLIIVNLCVATIVVFIKTNRYLEVLSAIISPDYCYIWLDQTHYSVKLIGTNLLTECEAEMLRKQKYHYKNKYFYF